MEVEILQLELISRQDQFATLFHNIKPEQLRGLKFCNLCGGQDYQWTNWSMTDINPDDFSVNSLVEDVREYRFYLFKNMCNACDGTGFEGGSFSFSTEQWLKLGSVVK